MPAVESCVGEIILGGDWGFVECFVVRMLELDILKPFVLWEEAIADDLHFGLMRDGLKIWV